MKKILLLLTGISSALPALAQLPSWTISPECDTIYVKVADRLLQGETTGRSSLWTMEGKPVFDTEHTIMPFRDGVATIVRRDRNTISGFVDMDGRFTALPDLEIAYSNPFFENGHVICREKEGYAFYRKDGLKAEMPASVRAYPFHGGYAPYLTYGNMEKRKDPHYGYYKADGKTPEYKVLNHGNPKMIEAKDIDFLSGIGPNGKGVAVIKDKLYWFDPSSELFEPLLWGDEESEKKRHLSLAGDHGQYFLNLPADSVMIRAKYGKNQTACLRFDRELVPTVFNFGEEVCSFATESPEVKPRPTVLSSYGTEGNYGLSLASKRVLPQQFQQTGLMFDNKAFVKKEGKWGVIEIIPDLTFSMMINKNEDIAFRHQKFETQIRLDLPAAISARDARIDIPESTGCMIDKTSRETKDTESGNFVTYNCTLNIPQSLPDTITDITYTPVGITYDGISLFDMPISVKAWHLKYYNVDPIESETTIANGVASFTLNINAQRNVGEGDYPFEVRVEADSVFVEYEKLSETRHKCIVSNLQEGVNSLNIYVTEKGCPPSVFPFEISYTKPAPKKRRKEDVVIRKKSPEAVKPAPRLEI